MVVAVQLRARLGGWHLAWYCDFVKGVGEMSFSVKDFLSDEDAWSYDGVTGEYRSFTKEELKRLQEYCDSHPKLVQQLIDSRLLASLPPTIRAK